MISLEPILSKIPELRKSPHRRSLTLAAKQNTLYNVRFARATKNSSKKEKSILLGSFHNC